MRLTTLKKTETTLDSVVMRLYPNLTDSERQAATTELLKANPQLSGHQPLRPGLVVKVPTQPGRKAKTGGVTDDPVEDLRASLKQALSGYQEQLDRRFEQGLADAARQEDLLKQKDIAAAIKSTPDASELAKELAGALKLRRKALEEDRKTRMELFDRIAKDLDALLD